ncbi:MAG: hypothetical protein U1E83_10680 [Methylotetracoccus sp.]
MLRTARWSVVLLYGLLAFGCSAEQIRRSSPRGMESDLSAVGFKVLIADSAQKQTMLHELPPQTISRVDRPDGTYYLYADPNLCACLYVGRQAEYNAYQKLLVERQMSDQALIGNEIAEDQRAGWGPSGAWGNWGYGSGMYGYGGYNMRPAWDPW